MDDFLNDFMDKASDFLASKPGLLPLIGIGLILFNFLLQIYPGPDSWIAASNLFMHLGLIVGFIGFLLIKALG